ncbi:hypothetical protein GGF42_002893, partial [Coemansia sp. RSA 2424]
MVALAVFARALMLVADSASIGDDSMATDALKALTELIASAMTVGAASTAAAATEEDSASTGEDAAAAAAKTVEDAVTITGAVAAAAAAAKAVAGLGTADCTATMAAVFVT